MPLIDPRPVVPGRRSTASARYGALPAPTCPDLLATRSRFLIGVSYRSSYIGIPISGFCGDAVKSAFALLIKFSHSRRSEVFGGRGSSRADFAVLGIGAGGAVPGAPRPTPLSAWSLPRFRIGALRLPSSLSFLRVRSRPRLRGRGDFVVKFVASIGCSYARAVVSVVQNAVNIGL
jgi:hypothetical protein